MTRVSPPLEENEDAWLTLSLSPVSMPQPQQSQPLVPPMHPFSSPQEPHQEMLMLLHEFDLPSKEHQEQEAGPSSNQIRARRKPVRGMNQRKSETIIPPYPWATTKRATLYSLDHLLSHGMRTIPGTMKCKGCDKQYDIEFDLLEKFNHVSQFIEETKTNMFQRAPSTWMSPVLPICKLCGQENSLKPLITKKRTINWLFLLLGQMLGCCTLAHLKYFCKHANLHRTGAKDRVLYLTYMGLCKQLNPEGPFDT
ncbi:uncharacterized protein LOC133309845 [Gastrolobium bilobum]|uniref:uncharacterized protein LOC133309845 n=1 Tax=Gastrolobium bilobum TaxID=150636 RepID=UPI002AB04638|nr:uncharacterized protein LOC133309845 [Gastrolobium bilobum]